MIRCDKTLQDVVKYDKNLRILGTKFKVVYGITFLSRWGLKSDKVL